MVQSSVVDDSSTGCQTNTSEDLHETGIHCRAAARKLHHVRGRAWGKLAAAELWSRGNIFFAVMNHASPSGSRMDTFWFASCQENST